MCTKEKRQTLNKMFVFNSMCCSNFKKFVNLFLVKSKNAHTSVQELSSILLSIFHKISVLKNQFDYFSLLFIRLIVVL